MAASSPMRSRRRCLRSRLPPRAKDRQILAIAYGEQRIVLTNDKDFGDLAFRDRLPQRADLVRLGYVPIDVGIALLREVLMDHAEHLDQFIVVLPGGSRVASAPEAP